MGLMESLCKYHVGRGKLISKKIKFPLSADHDVGIQQLDEKQYFMMLNMVRRVDWGQSRAQCWPSSA